MIYGIGIDIVEIQRMRDAGQKWGRKFFEKILNPDEISYCFRKSDPYPSLAVRFAVKEAIIKAVSGEIPVNMKDIEVEINAKGKPDLNIKGNLDSFFKSKKIRHIHISLSHEKHYGVACVVLET